LLIGGVFDFQKCLANLMQKLIIQFLQSSIEINSHFYNVVQK
jgi:hypothetical protein